MPIYEYQCGSCEHIFDVLQKINEDPLKYCPECGEPQLKKLLSAPNFRLKGAGWYETDFKKGSKRNLADSGHDKAVDKKDDKPAKSGAGKSDGGAAKAD